MYAVQMSVYDIASKYAILLIANQLMWPSRKDTGNSGEEAVASYLKKQGFHIVGRNIARKTGELDAIAQKGDTLHFVEVKTFLCEEFLDPSSTKDEYDPSMNLHELKIRKVARTAEWVYSGKGVGRGLAGGRSARMDTLRG